MAEKFPVARHADMLEHSHRDDPVERTVKRAVVAQFEADALRQSRRSPPLVRDAMLLFRKGHARDRHAPRLRQVKAESAPSGADVGACWPGCSANFDVMWRFLARCASPMSIPGRSK